MIELRGLTFVGILLFGFAAYFLDVGPLPVLGTWFCGILFALLGLLVTRKQVRKDKMSYALMAAYGAVLAVTLTGLMFTTYRVAWMMERGIWP